MRFSRKCSISRGIISAKSNEEIKSFLTRQKDTYRNPYDKYEEDRKRQCIFAGSTNTRQFIPFDRTGARRFLPIAIDSSKAEKHILDDEKEARSYFDQLWAEVMEIYWSTENKSSLLKFSKEMEQEISEYRKQFTQEDTMAGMIQGWTLIKVVMYVPSRSGKKPLTILTGSRKNSRQMRSVPLWIRRSLAGREPESTDFQRKDMADREAGSGKEQKKRVATNRIKMDLQS